MSSSVQTNSTTSINDVLLTTAATPATPEDSVVTATEAGMAYYLWIRYIVYFI